MEDWTSYQTEDYGAQGNDPYVIAELLAAERPWNYHKISNEAVLSELQTSEGVGLNDKQVEVLLKQHGPNVISEAQHMSTMRLFIQDLQSLSIQVVLVLGLLATFICFLRQGLLQGFLTILILLGYTLLRLKDLQQIRQYVNKPHSQVHLISDTVEAIRGSKPTTLQSQNLVPGDIILLHESLGVPCDVRLLEADQLLVNYLPYTGVSQHIKREALPQGGGNSNVLGATNVVLAGSICIAGTGKGVVVNTGRDTLLYQMFQRRVDSARELWAEDYSAQHFVYGAVACLALLCSLALDSILSSF